MQDNIQDDFSSLKWVVTGRNAHVVNTKLRGYISFEGEMLCGVSFTGQLSAVVVNENFSKNGYDCSECAILAKLIINL